MRTYRVQEFAELAGVTVKALHHYDRLGILTPQRTGAGYRVYSDLHLERLEQIVALKFLGLPLRRIRGVLGRDALALPDALRAQRLAIERKQELLSRAVGAIRAAEESIAAGQPADPSILKKIIEVIQMQNDIEPMKTYYSEEAWERHRLYYENGPAPEWLALYRDANALLGEDPGSPPAQALADRWLALSLRAYRGDPKVQIDSPMAWMDRENWPPAMRQRIAALNLEEVSGFLGKAAMSGRKKYFSEGAWIRYVELRKQALEDPLAVSRSWQEHVDLLHEIESVQGAEDPAGETGQALAERWLAKLDAESAGDAAIKAGLMNAWTDRQNWSASLRWQVEGLATMTGERFERAASFIDQALIRLQKTSRRAI